MRIAHSGSFCQSISRYKRAETSGKCYVCSLSVAKEDKCDRKALLQLYNALNGTSYQDENELQIVTMKNVVYMSMNNDIALILASTLNLYEHQSTVCPNMPLRFFLYLAGEFEAVLGSMDANIYSSKR